MTNDEMKQTSASAEKPAEANTSGGTNSAPKKSPASPRPASSKGTSNGGKASGKKNSESEFVHTTTAPKSEKAAKGASSKNPPRNSGNSEKKNSARNFENMPSSKPAHRVIPYVMFGLAAFLGICMILNLFCNSSNVCASNPSSHLMGSVGYWICYLFFGLFGAAAFLLPFLTVYMALYWKDFIDNKLTLEKSLVSVLLLLFFGGFIHAFSFIQLDKSEWHRTASELMKLGAEMRGGGVIGGGFGYFLAKYMNRLGALTAGFFLTVLTAFFFLGQSPIRLIKRAIALAKAKKAKKAETTAAEKDKKEAKKTAQSEDAEEKHSDKNHERQKKEKTTPNPNVADEDDGLAPMPMPVLDASDDTPVNNLYVPADIGKTMRSGAPMQRKPQAPSVNSYKPSPATAKTSPTPQSRQPQSPVGDSMEAVFPRSAAEAKNVKRVQKNDQNFELGNIFVEQRGQKHEAVKHHAPLPPEAPLPSSGTAAGMRRPPEQASVARPMTGAPVNRPANNASNGAPARPTAHPSQSVMRTAASPNGKTPITVRPATAPAGVKAASESAVSVGNGQKPIFRPSEANSNTDFGLSNEEFEKREANAPTLPRTKASAKPSPADASKKAAADGKKATTTDTPEKKPSVDPANKAYIFPPISYLHPSEPMTAENHSEIKANMEKLYATLNDFNVRINEITYSCGPTVTRYEIYPSAGVRVRSITNLADDIALSFAVQSVRMEAIPGKSAIGVEVPNTTRQTVFLRELLESPAFTEKASRLTAGLGADVAGAPLLFDIAKMPHLLVAGATGMGKSVCINCIIMSILFKARPDQVKLILVDPKKVEFSLYKGIPHLMAPIIVTPKDAAGALQAAVNEMEDRFTKIQDVGVSNIEGYNKAAEKDPDLPPMPHIVIIIDELADLMLTARDEVEDSICRLAQKARAAGMHIIVGTQRPSVDVVTGLIKSNMPSRVACTVASQVDSRTILDIAGAEKLLGKGDMLFAPVGAMKPTRVQGAFVSDAEVEKICEFIRATNGTAVYNDAFTSKMKEYSAMCGNKKNKNAEAAVSLPGESGDNKYVDAIRISIEENRVSTSLLQRKLGIGYSRAAKIIDRMEEEGLVSKPDGAKPRNILISAEQFIERYIEGDAGAEAAEDEEA